MITIAIAADHRGFEIKYYLIAQKKIADHEIEWIDKGSYTAERTDYPAFAIEVATLVSQQKVHYGILLCGTGVGMTIVANRFSKVYAGLVWNEETARRAKQEDNINILSLPADYITREQALIMIDVWLSAQFKQGRYAQRIKMIDEID